MGVLTDRAWVLWAKKSRDGNLTWLPLVIHLQDSALVARRIWNKWLSEGARRSIIEGIGNGDSDLALRLFIFLAVAHDIGKATPVFQGKETFLYRTELDWRIYEKLEMARLPMKHYAEFSHPGKTPHALATQLLLQQEGCHPNVAVILGAHHGKPVDTHTAMSSGIGSYGANYHLGDEGKSEWSGVQKELIQFALNVSGFRSLADLPVPNRPAQMLLSGLVIMADWVASNEDFFPYIGIDERAEEVDLSLRGADAWKALALPCPWVDELGEASDSLYWERFHFHARPLQAEVEKIAKEIRDPGILVIEATMGVGKTEAALVAAELFARQTKRTGLFFALPTQATSDGLFPRLLEWTRRLDAEGRYSIRLAHGQAQFNDLYQELGHFSGSTNVEPDQTDGPVIHEWFEGRKKALLADYVVGTIDQLLLAALKQKHIMLRHLGLSNKVVVIDECHAYDAYMSQYLEMALRWLGAYKVPVVVLSATLPAQQRRRVIQAYLDQAPSQNQADDPLGKSRKEVIEEPEWISSRDYPLITYTDGREVRQTTVAAAENTRNVRMKALSETELESFLGEKLSNGGCAGIIVNTVARSQEVFQRLQEHFGEETVRLLHAQLLTGDRVKQERELLAELGKLDSSQERPYRRIVVGTQVLEQSLDIDFDILITDICPMDLLLQRIGRLQRHVRVRPEKLQEAICCLLNFEEPEFEKGTTFIYGEYLLRRTRILLPKQVRLPDDIAHLVQETYGEEEVNDPDLESYRAAWEKWQLYIKEKTAGARKYRINTPSTHFKGSIEDLLNMDVLDREQCGEATVRDTDESIEVLLIQESELGELSFLPWIEGGRRISPNSVLPGNEARALARQRIRLPRVLCAPRMIGRTIEELERRNKDRVSQWQGSPWLKGELLLILDKNQRTELLGYSLMYSRSEGLLCRKETEEHVKD